MITRGRRHKPAERGAFTTILVISTMVLLSAALVGLSSLAAHEAARTREVRTQTQLRQYLLAGIPAAQEEVKAHGTAARDVQIPLPLEGATLTLHLAPTAGGVEVTVRAALGTARATEVVGISTAGEVTSTALTQTHS